MVLSVLRNVMKEVFTIPDINMFWNNLTNIIFELIALSAGIFRFKYLNKPQKIIFLFVCFGVTTEITLGTLLVFHLIKKTIPGLHFYYPVEFLLISLFYYYELRHFIKPKILKFIIISFLIYCIVNPIFIQGLQKYPNTARAIEDIILVCFSLTLFYKMMDEVKIRNLWREPAV